MYTGRQLGTKTEFPVDLAAADCTRIEPRDFTTMTIRGPVFRNRQLQEFIVDPSPIPQPSAMFVCDRSLEDAAKNTSTGVSTLHAWARALPRAAHSVFIAIGGPQGHGDSLTVAARKRAVASHQVTEPLASAGDLAANLKEEL